MHKYEMRISQFGLISNVQQETSDMLLVTQPAALFSPETRKGHLYIVAEVQQEGVRSHDACELVIRTIHKIFYEDSSYSITSSLRKAISAANKALYQNNFNSTAIKRAFVGVTCAVIKDDDLYIAQVMPSQAYVLTDGKLRALPTSPAWNNGQTVTSILKPNSIGVTLSLEPEFYRAVLQPGDAVVLCSSNLSRLLGREEVQHLLGSLDPVAITNGLRDLCKQNALPEAHGLALCITPLLSSAAQEAPLSRAGISERGKLLIRSASNAVERLTGEIALLVKGRNTHIQQQKAEIRYEHNRRADAQLRTLQDEPPPMPTLPPTPSLDLGESLNERIEQEREGRRTRIGALQERSPDTGLPPSAFLGEGDYYPPPVSSERQIDLSDTPGMAAVGRRTRRSLDKVPPLEPTLGERIARPFEQALDTFTSMGRRRRLRRPPPNAMRQASRGSGLSYRKERAPLPWFPLIALIVLVTVLVWYGQHLAYQNTQQQAASALEEAEREVAAIRNAPDDVAAQQQLDKAEAALANLSASGIITTTQENRLRFEAVEREYERQLGAIEKLSYFEDLTEVGKHPQAAASATFSSLVVPPAPTSITNTVGFSWIYALDENAGVVYRMRKSGGPLEPFLRPNDSISNGVPVGQVKALAWRLDNVVAVAQSQNTAFNYYFRNNENWNYTTLGGSEEWGQKANGHFRVVSYDGNLYVWGAAPGQVLKYRSGQTSNPYEPWIQNFGGQKTETAIDLAVDGSVYLLQPDGRILVYETGASGGEYRRDIAPPTVTPKLVTAAGFFVSGDKDSGFIYLVDRVNERIIQIDKKTGALVQQIRARRNGPIRLDQFVTLQVDDSGPKPILYLVNGSQILRGSLPDPPRPLRENTPSGPANVTQPASATSVATSAAQPTNTR